MKDLTIINMDKFERKPVEIKEGVIEDISVNGLEEKLMSSNVLVNLSYPGYFALFKLIAEKPKKAIELLKKAAENQACTLRGSYDYNDLSRRTEMLKEALEGNKEFVETAKEDLLEKFKTHYIAGPDIFSRDSSKLLAVVKDNPYASLRFFQTCHEEMTKNCKHREFWKGYKSQVRAIIAALKTGDFSNRGQKYTIEEVNKEEVIKVPEDVDVKDPISLATFLMEKENAPIENLGFIDDPAIIIPRDGESCWNRGLLIVTYPCSRMETDTVYKTEKPHPDEEIVEKTTGMGKIVRPKSGDILRILAERYK